LSVYYHCSREKDLMTQRVDGRRAQQLPGRIPRQYDRSVSRVVTGDEARSVCGVESVRIADDEPTLQLYVPEARDEKKYERLLARYAFAVRDEAVCAGKEMSRENVGRWCDAFLKTATSRPEIPPVVQSYFRERWGGYYVTWYANYAMGMVVIRGWIYMFIPVYLIRNGSQDVCVLHNFLQRFEQEGLASVPKNAIGVTSITEGDEVLPPLVKQYTPPHFFLRM